MPKAILGFLLVTAAGFAQAPAALSTAPQFEVASIKPAEYLIAQFTSGKAPHRDASVELRLIHHRQIRQPEQRKAPMETVVVDHLEKTPTDN